MTPLSLAFVPLTDSAVVIAAKEMGFAAAEGLALDLVRSTSWATLRDNLVYRKVQAAHMLAPLAVAVTLGLSQQPTRLAAPFKLGMNGNALTLSGRLAAALDPTLTNRIDDPIATSHDFAAALGLHFRKPVIGIVHRFSSHALMLRYWLSYAGIDPDRDIVLRVLPPSFMVEAMGAGDIDGFIAGEPWNSIAVAQGLGEIAAVSVRIWERSVEKVLATRADWAQANADTLDALLRALDSAAAWCDDPANHAALAILLAEPGYVGQPAELIALGLNGRFPLRTGEAPVQIPDFLLFHREAANFPWRSQALWIYSQFVRWGMIDASPEAERAAADVFRSDIYRRALAGGTTPIPTSSLKVEGAVHRARDVGALRGALVLGPDRFFDGRIFDPDAIAEYFADLRKG